MLGFDALQAAGGHVDTASERRASRRFTMALPVKLRPETPGDGDIVARTRDVSFKGLYFLTDRGYEVGAKIDFLLTLPKEITLATDVNIRCLGLVVRRETVNGRAGVAARIERYEFVPQE